jgi:hypothetical protein
MSEAELAADVDELRAAVLEEIDRDRDHARGAWPATVRALDRIRADAQCQAEPRDRVSRETDAIDANDHAGASACNGGWARRTGSMVAW